MVKSVVESLPEAVIDLAEETLIRVLHVDDEAGFLKAAKQILEMQGPFQVETASSVEEATGKMEEKPFDVIVSDYVMPGKDGLEFLKELRDSGNKIPFIIFTGKGREEVAIKALNLGADYYLHKLGSPETVYGELTYATLKAVKASRAEQLLMESEEKYRNLVENSKDAIAIVDFKGNVLFANNAAERLTGYTLKEGMGMNIRKIIPKRLWPKSLAMLLKARMGKPISYFEYEIKRRDGTAVQVETGGQAILKDGKPIAIQIITRDITERKKAEETLKESEEKFRNLAEQSPNMIFINKKGRVVYANKKCEEVMGYKREEFYSPDFNFLTLIAPESMYLLKSSFSRHMKGEEVAPFEYTLITKKGKRIEAILTTKLITYKGETTILGILTDITERKKAEEELGESEEKYRELINGMNDTVWVIDFDGNFIDVNDAAVEVLGYSREDLLSMGPPDIDTSLTVEEIRGLIKQMPTDEIQVFETTHTTKDGKTIPVEISSSLVTYQGKHAILSIARNITERKRAEEAIAKSEEKYRSLVELAPDSIMTFDLEGVITSCNTAATRLSSYPKDELVGKHFSDLGVLREEDISKYLEMLSSTQRGKVPKPFEVIWKRKDGTPRFGEVRFSLIDEKDKIVGIQAIMRDITERKQAEKSLKATLEKVQILNEKLGVVGKLTRHDARNKLNAIANNVYLARQTLAGDHEALEYLGEIESSCDQVKRVFDFARIYESLGVEELAYMDVEKYVREAGMLFSGLKGVEVVNNCHGVTVLADSLLRQLFYNLIDNSLKHGERVSQIRVHYKADKNKLKLIYEDDGVGIPKTEKEKIFKEGYGKGTGYGLYLIRKMCEVYGWNIRETGKSGKGAQFTITIPKINENGKTNYRLPQLSPRIFGS